MAVQRANATARVSQFAQLMNQAVDIYFEIRSRNHRWTRIGCPVYVVNSGQSVPIRLKLYYAKPVQAQCRLVKRSRHKVGDYRIYFKTCCVASVQFAQV